MTGLGKREPLPADVRFGRKMRAARLTLGLSQAELGIAIGVTFQQIQKYERGTNRVRASMLESLAAALNVPITYFFEGHPSGNGDEHGGGANLAGFLATAEGVALCRAFQRIESKEMRTAVINLLQDMTRRH
jgi:transcriptional regulator with XRE-family HTH domain